MAVGERRYPTPLGASQVTHITWNPWWYPPRTEWARNDTIHAPGDLNPMGRVKLQFGGLYFLHAIKTVPGMRLIKPQWNSGLVRKLVPAAPKLNKGIRKVEQDD